LTELKKNATQVINFMHKIDMKFQQVSHILATADPIERRLFHENDLQPSLNDAKKRGAINSVC
jgi:hypothetical protein